MYHLSYTYVAAGAIVPTLVRQMLHYQAGVQHDYVIVSVTESQQGRHKHVHSHTPCRVLYVDICVSSDSRGPSVSTSLFRIAQDVEGTYVIIAYTTDLCQLALHTSLSLSISREMPLCSLLSILSLYSRESLQLWRGSQKLRARSSLQRERELQRRSASCASLLCLLCLSNLSLYSRETERLVCAVISYIR